MKKYHFLIFLLISLAFGCQSPNKVVKIEGKQLRINDTLQSNEELENFIRPYAEHLQKEMSTTLAYAPKSLSKTDSKYNTALGNMMADAVMELVNPIFFKRTQNNLDGVLLNYGGIRSTINKGAITTKTAYNIMPFENEAVVVKLNAEAMEELFAYLAENKTAHPISGMKLVLSKNGEIKEALVQNQPLTPEKSYYIATNDYLQKGGDHMDFLAKTDTVLKMDYKLRNIFIDYFKVKDTIAPVRDNRFIKED